MSDDPETIRQVLCQHINADARDRQALEQLHGRVWNTTELSEEFEVIGFAAPVVVVRRRNGGATGSLFFQHSPRFYFGFQVDA